MKYIRVIAVIIIIFGLALWVTKGVAQNPPSLYDLGMQKYLAGQYMEATDYFRQVLRNSSDPDIEKANFYFIKCYYKLGQPATVEQELVNLKTRNSDSPALDDATFLCGLAYYEDGNYVKAAEYYEQFLNNPAFQASPYLGRTAFSQMKTCYYLSDWSGLEAAYQVFLENPSLNDDPNRPNADFLHARFLVNQKHELSKACKEYREALERHPSNGAKAQARLEYGILLEKTRLWDKAVEELDKVITEHGTAYPRQASSALVEKGFALYFKGEKDEAKACFEQVLKTYSASARASEAALWKEALEQPKSVANWKFQHEIIQRLDSGFVFGVHVWDAESRFWELSNHPVVQDYLEDPSVSETERAEGLYRCALAAFRAGRTKEAIERANMVLERFPSVSDAVQKAEYLKAFNTYHQGCHADAYNQFLQFMDKYLDGPYADNALFVMSLCMKDLGDREEAILCLEDLLLYYPDSDKRYWAEQIYASCVEAGWVNKDNPKHSVAMAQILSTKSHLLEKRLVKAAEKSGEELSPPEVGAESAKEVETAAKGDGEK